MSTFLGIPIEQPSILSWPGQRAVTTLSGRQRPVHVSHQRFDLSFSLTDVDGSRQLTSKLRAHHAKYMNLSFPVPMPQDLHRALSGAGAYGKYAAPGHTPAPTAALALGATGFSIRSANAYVIPAGWFFRFSNDTKVYQVINDQDVRVSSTGLTNFEFFPALRTAVSLSDTITWSPNLTCMYDATQPLLLPVDDNGVVVARVNLVESV